MLLCLPSVDALKELRPKGICPNVVSLVQIPRVTLLFPKCIEVYIQRAKKVLSDSPGLVNFVSNLPDGQVMFHEEFE